MEKAFDLNAVYQLPSHYADSGHAQQLADPVEFKKCLGDSKYFNDYFLFFRKEIETHGIPATVNTFIFGDDERAADMFDRFFGGKSCVGSRKATARAADLIHRLSALYHPPWLCPRIHATVLGR